MENNWLVDEFEKFMDPAVVKTPEAQAAIKKAVDRVNERFEAALGENEAWEHTAEPGTLEFAIEVGTSNGRNALQAEARARWYGGTSK